jgi:4-amino-4-deoxy-L-arabinose transferase-like glycosyltransferase
VGGVGRRAVIAIYPPFVRGAGELLSEPLGTVLLAIATLLVVSATDRPRVRTWAAAGAVVGLANLTRPDFVFLAPLLALVVFVHERGRRGGSSRRRRIPGAMLVIFVAAGAVVIAPWSVYVSARAGHPVAVTTGAGAAMYIGTSLEGRGSSSGLRRAYRERVRRRFDRRDVRLQEVFRIVAPAPSVETQDALLRRKAVASLWHGVRRPSVFVPMTADKQRRVWWNSSNPGQSAMAGWMVPYHRLVLVSAIGAALAGIVLLAGRRRLALLLGVVPVAYVAALHILMPAEPRFNVPVMPLLVASGAAGASAVMHARRRWTSSRMRAART